MQATIPQKIRDRWGNELRLERHRRRLTQPDVAELADIAQASVSAVEAGRGGFNAIMKVAAALGVTLSNEPPDEMAS